MRIEDDHICGFVETPDVEETTTFHYVLRVLKKRNQHNSQWFEFDLTHHSSVISMLLAVTQSIHWEAMWLSSCASMGSGTLM